MGQKKKSHLNPISEAQLMIYANQLKEDWDQHPMHQSAHWSGFQEDFISHISSLALSEFRQNGLSAGLDANIRSDNQNPAHPALLAHNFRQLSAVFSDYIHLAEELDIGKPARWNVGGIPVSDSSLNLTYFLYRIVTAIRHGINQNQLSWTPQQGPLSVLEIGPGFGGLSRLIAEVYPNLNLWLVDIPQGLTLSAYYLSRTIEKTVFKLSNGRVVGNEDATRQIQFCPGWETSQIPNWSVDLAINCCSLGEMTADAVELYLTEIQRILKPGGLFFCVNRYIKKVGEDFRILGQFPFDKCWQVWESSPKSDQSTIHELILQRTAEPHPSLPPILTQISTIATLLMEIHHQQAKTVTVTQEQAQTLLPLSCVATEPNHRDLVVVAQPDGKRPKIQRIYGQVVDETYVVQAGLKPQDRVFELKTEAYLKV